MAGRKKVRRFQNGGRAKKAPGRREFSRFFRKYTQILSVYSVRFAFEALINEIVALGDVPIPRRWFPSVFILLDIVQGSVINHGQKVHKVYEELSRGLKDSFFGAIFYLCAFFSGEIHYFITGDSRTRLSCKLNVKVFRYERKIFDNTIFFSNMNFDCFMKYIYNSLILLI